MRVKDMPDAVNTTHQGQAYMDSSQGNICYSCVKDPRTSSMEPKEKINKNPQTEKEE